MNLFERNRLYLDTVKPSELFLHLSYDEIGTERKRTIYYLDDNYIGFGFLMMPLPGANDQTMKRVAQLMSSDWPVGTIIAFSLFGSPDIEPYVSAYEKCHQTENDYLREVIDKRSDYLRRASEDVIDQRSQTRMRSMQLMVSIKLPCVTIPPDKRYLDDLVEWVERSYNALKAIGFDPVEVTPEILCTYLNPMFNWDINAFWKKARNRRLYNEEHQIRDSFMDPGNRINKPDEKTLMLGDKHVGVMSIKRFPEYFCVHDMTKMIGDVTSDMDVGIKDNFLITMTVTIPDVMKEKAALESKRTKNAWQADGPIAKWVSKYKDVKEDFDSLFEDLEKGHKNIKMNLTATLFANSKQELDGVCSAVQNYWNGLDFNFLRETYLSLPIFLQQIPMNAEYFCIPHLWRYRTLSTAQAAHFAPIVAEWFGGMSPALVFSTRLGNPMFLDLFESDTSFSASILAESGSGKSFLTNYMITNYLAYTDQYSDGARVWVIDIGYSYKALCERVNGTYIDFDDEALCINPFEFIVDYKKSSDMLVGIISVMAAPNEGLTDLQNSQLREVLMNLWNERRNDITIDIVANSLKAHDMIVVQNIGHQLYPFTSEGEFGSFFNGKSNIDFNQTQMTVLELASLKERPLLQRAVLYMIMYSISQSISTLPKNQRKQIILDESWALLNASEDVALFMSGLYRTIRKSSGSCTVISQSIADLFQSQSGRAIAENSPHMFLLGQTKASIQRAKDNNYLALDDYAYGLMESVQTHKGFYSEIFVIKGRQYGVARLAVDREAQLLYTTDAKETGLLNALQEQGLSRTEAIDTFIQHERRGTLGELRTKVEGGKAA
jgi:conjugal transfer ATP-binding protein TraC